MNKGRGAQNPSPSLLNRLVELQNKERGTPTRLEFDSGRAETSSLSGSEREPIPASTTVNSGNGPRNVLTDWSPEVTQRPDVQGLLEDYNRRRQLFVQAYEAAYGNTGFAAQCNAQAIR